MKGHSRPCAVNVHGMREGEFPLTPAKSDLNILVIGAGPGGMKAAATAAERGYRVSLYEKNTYMVESWQPQAHRGSRRMCMTRSSI